MSSKAFMKTALSTIVATGLSLSAATAHAEKKVEMEKCYGIVKAGKNDCGVKGENTCAGQNKVNNDPNAWIFVPKGVCNKITGGSLKPGDSSNKKSS